MTRFVRCCRPTVCETCCDSTLVANGKLIVPHLYLTTPWSICCRQNSVTLIHLRKLQRWACQIKSGVSYIGLRTTVWTQYQSVSDKKTKSNGILVSMSCVSMLNGRQWLMVAGWSVKSVIFTACFETRCMVILFSHSDNVYSLKSWLFKFRHDQWQLGSWGFSELQQSDLIMPHP